MNRYAQQLLAPTGALQQEVNARLSRMGVDPAGAVPLKDAYLVSFPAGAFGKAQDSASLRQAADAVARFVADAHVANKGRPSDYFRSVEVLPHAETKDELKLEAAESKLVVGLRKDWKSLFTQYQAPSATELKQQWNEGEQFDSAALRKAWPLLNPTGELRTALTRTVRSGAEDLGRAMAGVRSSPDDLATRKASVGRLLGASVNGQVGSTTKPGSALLAEAQALLANVKTEKDLNLFLDRYAQRLNDPALQAASTVAVQQAVLSSSLDAKIRIEGGLVAVGNLHDISVSAAFTGGDISRLSRYVTEVPKTRNLDVDVKSKGVAVFTVDLIDVNATFDVMQRTAGSQKVLETAALDEALDVLRR